MFKIRRKRIFDSFIIAGMVILFVAPAVFTVHCSQKPNQKMAAELIKKANTCHARKDYDQAVTLYNRAIQLMPDSTEYASFHLVVGDMLFESKKYQEAIQSYKKLVDAIPEHDQGWTQLGICHVNLNRFDMAVDYFDKSISLEPNAYLPYFYGGWAYSQVGNTPKAKEYIRKAFQLNPELEKTQPDLKKFIETE